MRTILVRDVNGNTLTSVDVDVSALIDEVEAHVTDSGNVMVTLMLDDNDDSR